jgi:multidrug transporter EmrE-like cation transporter
LLIASCIIAVIADMLFIFWAKKETHPTWLIGMAFLLNTIGTIIWIYCLRFGIESAFAITFYALFTVAGCSVVGYFVFKEHLSVVNFIGLILSVLSILLISI